jgi:hypothetical protein
MRRPWTSRGLMKTSLLVAESTSMTVPILRERPMPRAAADVHGRFATRRRPPDRAIGCPRYTSPRRETRDKSRDVRRIPIPVDMLNHPVRGNQIVPPKAPLSTPASFSEIASDCPFVSL